MCQRAWLFRHALPVVNRLRGLIPRTMKVAWYWKFKRPQLHVAVRQLNGICELSQGQQFVFAFIDGCEEDVDHEGNLGPGGTEFDHRIDHMLNPR